MIQQGYGSICICDKCKKVITNMEYIQIRSIFPYIIPNSKLTSNTNYKSFNVIELCYDCYDDFIRSLYENGFINKDENCEILGKKKTILNVIKEKTK